MTCPRLQYHELSTLFPLINGEDFALMAKDMEANGQREPIVLFEGKILDGRNRYRICRELEIEPITVQYEGDDPLGLVLSLNMHRRQLTVAQRAIVAAELVRRKREQESNRGAESEVEAPSTLPGVDETAKALGISPRSVSAALRVFKDGAEELCEAVKRGEIRVSAAEQLTKLDLNEQRALCERGPRAIAKAARELRMTSKPAGGTSPISQTKAVENEPLVPQQTQTNQEESSALAESPQPARKPTAQRMFELTEEGLYEGYDPESVAEEILSDLEDGLDTQALLFAAEVALKLKERLALRQHRR
ncbi:hypothetical protein [Aquipseudomonas alcaligenes]|uniref:Plasmid replication/partition related protein n=1 Tax=Aquipseudomonas alcaligenes TaxID=43263 RepID=A0A1N6X8W3_AQUAC|nr:hypothetical protein [Pseudomonas alcaligenes]SIQ98766.1 hypothetical protein SAMN05878282_11228 [Pseudomonas alcaligenes]